MLGRLMKRRNHMRSNQIEVLLRKGMRSLIQNGFSITLKKVRSYLLFSTTLRGYHNYQMNIEEAVFNSHQNSNILQELDYCPFISIVMPVYNVSQSLLAAAIESVRGQIYTYWELCIYDDGSSNKSTLDFLNLIGQDYDIKIKVEFGKMNNGIVHATNAAISMSSGDYVAFMDNDDLLTPDALLQVVQCLQKQPYDMVYSDEDKMEMDETYCEPHFKPGFSPDLLLCGNYISHFSVYKKSVGDAIGWLREGYDGSQDYDLNLRVAQVTHEIYHIPRVLYHWRKIHGSTAEDAFAKPYAYISGKNALTDMLRTSSNFDSIALTIYPGHYKVIRRFDTVKSVTLIIETESLELGNWWASSFINVMSQSVHLQNITFDVGLVLSNELNKAAAYNKAALLSKGEILFFLTTHLDILNAEQLSAFIGHAIRPEIGAVGCTLLKDQNVFQTGIILGCEGNYGFAHFGLKPDDFGHHGSLQDIRNYSAVSKLCMMTRRNVFNELGGFNSSHFSKTLFDIDFCLRARREKGYFTLSTPYVQVPYHGSTRKDIDEKEWEVFLEHWIEIITEDPFYNTNLNKNRSDFTWNGGLYF